MLSLWVDELFKRFEAMYGSAFHQKWAGCDITMVKREWAETLDGVDGETIRVALKACREHNKFPPSSPEFHQLCKSLKVVASHKALPRPVVSNEENLKRLHAMMAGCALLKRTAA